jgi:hypothetical protein
LARAALTALALVLLFAAAGEPVGAGAALPDDRAWELVSPVDKNGGGVALPSEAGAGSTRAAAQGGAIAYASAASFGQAAGASPFSQYIARRAASGWVSENITPAQLAGAYEGNPYLTFSADLSRALMAKPLRSPDCDPCPPGYLLRDNETGQILAELTDPSEFEGAPADPPAVPPGAVFLAASTGGSTVYYREAGELYRRHLETTTQIAIGSEVSDAAAESSGASADGARLFLTTDHKLLPPDTNNDSDVYQWESGGTGSCAKALGCLDLISSGRSEGGATFAGASASGADVFFLTDRSLVPSDPGSVDLYDARVGGGFPAPSEPIPCEGNSCQALPPLPVDPPLGTALAGLGNPQVRYAGTRSCPALARRARRRARTARRLARRARRTDSRRLRARVRARRARARAAFRAARRCHAARRGRGR